MSKIIKDEYVSATELSKLAYCPATVKQRVKPSGRNARSRSQYYGDLIHAETEQVILRIAPIPEGVCSTSKFSNLFGLPWAGGMNTQV